MYRNHLNQAYDTVSLKETVLSANTGADAIKRAPIVEYETDYRCLRIGDISNNRSFKNWGYTTADDSVVEKFLLKKDDIIIARTGSTIGVSKYIYKDMPSLFNNGLIRLRIDKEKYNPLYIYYNLQTINFEGFINAISSGTSTQPNMKIKDLLEYRITDFPLSIQNSIVNILSTFDAKIENNNAIITNLEEQAQTIFKSWFMDSALFQDEEFETKKLGELFEFIKGKKPKTISEVKKEGFVPYLVKKYIDGDEATFTSSDDGILIDDLDIFMLMDGANSGNIYYGYHGILGSTFSFFKNVNEMVNEYIYWYLLINQESVKNQNTGSAIPHANKDYINNLEVALPIDIETNKVLKRLKDIRLYTINIRRENNKLSETRDTLLPKLMSGEIRVEEAIEVE